MWGLSTPPVHSIVVGDSTELKYYADEDDYERSRAVVHPKPDPDDRNDRPAKNCHCTERGCSGRGSPQAGLFGPSGAAWARIRRKPAARGERGGLLDRRGERIEVPEDHGEAADFAAELHPGCFDPSARS
jgi:hypothetical protein